MSAVRDATLGSVFSALGAAANNALFLSQLPLIRKLIGEGSSDRYDYLPSLTLMSSMSLWSGYTVFVLPTTELYVANVPGMILPFVYLCVFVLYSSTSTRRAQIIGLTLLCLGITWGFTCGLFLSPTSSNVSQIYGGVTTAVSCCFFFSPLVQLRIALRERSIRRVPVVLSLVQVFQNTVWIIASYYLNDVFILAVNAVGCGFALLQLSVIAVICFNNMRAGLPYAGEEIVKGAGAIEMVMAAVPVTAPVGLVVRIVAEKSDAVTDAEAIAVGLYPSVSAGTVFADALRPDTTK